MHIRHMWNIRSVNQVTETFYGEDIGQHTLALYTCALCGKTKTKKLKGLWEPQHLRGTKP